MANESMKNSTTGNEKMDEESQGSGAVVFPIVHSKDDAYIMYCEYAHKKGFSVCKSHVYWTHTRIIKTRDFTYSKAGHKRSNPIKEAHVKFPRLDKVEEEHNQGLVNHCLPASSAYEKALQIARDMNDKIMDFAVSLAKVADVDRSLGNEDAAVKGFQEAIEHL